ncbi:FKBP-type peptidyl-prolyl cis-trans isomerase [Hufsiella ginkgonis]|uniref:Peptidyl-prolyl cis-trans isomerase n=1 Tax=Hufsiella ginkgonis TaxID=2695274 RepID=A0A7K1Y1F5_9SPHI|nr:FKBP-type peptidyl-prolyl cis-trans isomerase [Hufsiella ginkgonis]MXV16947.1 hypothetical protein [Hufsiella ginkgonis]
MKLFSNRIFLLLFLSVTAFTACEKDYETVEQQDERNIQAYIKSSGQSFQQYGASGLYYKVEQAGTGDAIDFSKETPVLVSVRSLDGKFTATDTLAFYNRIYDFAGYLSLYGTKRTETLPTLVKTAVLKKNGSVRVLIPSRLAYGKNAYTNLPGYSNIQVPENASLDVTFKVLDEKKIDQYEDITIQKYLSANNLTGFSKLEGIYYKITKAGTGTAAIGVDSTVVVNYTGKLLSGKVFDSGTDYTATLSGLVVAWQKILPLVTTGATVRFVTPSKQAYGVYGSRVSGSTAIPAFSSLDFEVTVTKIE